MGALSLGLFVWETDRLQFGKDGSDEDAGFDPEQHPRWGIYYHLRDRELGDEYLSVNGDFPFGEDPSLWEVLELVK